MFEGVPNWPDPSRIWQVVDKHQVEILYTAPTALRALMREGDEWVQKTSRKSLKLLGTVGEPINPEAWGWYHRRGRRGALPDRRYLVADRDRRGDDLARCPARPTSSPAARPSRCSASSRRWSTSNGHILEGAVSGRAGHHRQLAGADAHRLGRSCALLQTYFTAYPGYYFTGDGCRRDEDGYYWITGRIDDVINVSGHRMGTAEVESALVAHEEVAEAAVVGMPHDIKGQGIYAYVTVNAGCEVDDELRDGAGPMGARRKSAPIATPDVIQFAPALPKTRSGKIMRRILRKIAEGRRVEPRRYVDAGRSGGGRSARREPAGYCRSLSSPACRRTSESWKPRPG